MRDWVNGVYLFDFKHLAIEKVYWQLRKNHRRPQIVVAMIMSYDIVHVPTSALLSRLFSKWFVNWRVEGIHGTVGASSNVETQSIKYPRGRVAIELESAAIKGERRQSSRRRRLDRVNSVSIISYPAVQDIGNICIRIIDIPILYNNQIAVLRYYSCVRCWCLQPFLKQAMFTFIVNLFI